MGIFDDIFPDLATTLVETLGDIGAVALRVPTSAYDPRTGARVSSFVDYPINTAPAQGYSAAQINGISIQVGDFRILANAQSVIDGNGAAIIPVPGNHSIVFKDRVYQVVSAQPVYSGQSVVSWTFQVRK